MGKLQIWLSTLLLVAVGYVLGFLYLKVSTYFITKHYMKHCKQRFSLCLDCRWHNKCKRYSDHLEDLKIHGVQL